ncbi:hypothetical protein [Flavobacterium sp. PL02]|uniref:hypothetical protein n=1 Tax=Flavobacterium sp. PL02 TaxID=3088354 RepID=UPI002B222D4D|nr:hypothetical protein [Flavobacterium sp. PL02]MEA9413931.1 hypothetical protein [Flavobacterium sp. PL02]
MLKNILNVEGAQKLTKSEQKLISGGAVGDWTYSEQTGYCVYSVEACGFGVYPKRYPGNWCCQK